MFLLCSSTLYPKDSLLGWKTGRVPNCYKDQSFLRQASNLHHNWNEIWGYLSQLKYCSITVWIRAKCQKKSSNWLFTMFLWCFSVMYGMILFGMPFYIFIWQALCAHNVSGKLLFTPSNVHYIGCNTHLLFDMCRYTYLYMGARLL